MNILTEPYSQLHEIPFQDRLTNLLHTIDTLYLPDKSTHLPPIARNYILGPESEWPYKNFRQAASDLEYRQVIIEYV